MIYTLCTRAVYMMYSQHMMKSVKTMYTNYVYYVIRPALGPKSAPIEQNTFPGKLGTIYLIDQLKIQILSCTDFNYFEN